jgi:uncharacterized protein YndB with AHSA1/START domain
MATSRPAPSLDQTVVISAPTPTVLEAFFDPHALASWWQAARSVTTPRTLGVFAVEWDATEARDEILGRLGGTFHGAVLEYGPSGFMLAEAYWVPPEGDPIGPMAFEVALGHADGVTTVRVRQTGFEEGPRWRRYYEVVAEGWQGALAALKTYCEQDLAERLWGRWGRITAAERDAARDKAARDAALARTAHGSGAKPPTG